jgi:hypothetical protein
LLRESYFIGLINSMLSNYGANQLIIFITDNVILSPTGSPSDPSFFFGFHGSQGGPIATAKTYIYAAYIEPGTTDTVFDVHPLSHEVAEWLNDPFVGSSAGINYIPPAVLGDSCIVNFETGDPLGATFTKTTNGTTYHLQDEVFLPWYLHSTPSFSVNGWYTFLNTPIPAVIINSPASISGQYSNVAALSFAPINVPIAGDIAYIGRGCPAGSISSGSPADPYLANPSGKIALIDRGACAVSLKIDAAARADAIGVLIGLVAPGDPISFSYGGGSVFVPSLVITQATSNLIKNALMSSPVNSTIGTVPQGFSTLCRPG